LALSIYLAANLVAVPIRVACAGDSITYGAAIQDRVHLNAAGAKLMAVEVHRYLK